MRDKITERI